MPSVPETLFVLSLAMLSTVCVQAQDFGVVQKLTASDAAGDHDFGVSVSISGDAAIVGARGTDDAGSNSGSAYIFQRDAGGMDNWGEVVKLTASDAATFDEFGQSVSISGDAVIVGAALNDDAGGSSGSAYIYSRDAGGVDNWGEVKKLTASDSAAGDQFGEFVSISGDAVIVGAPKNDGVGNRSGSAYIFSRNAGGADNWGEVKMLTASDADAGDEFGFCVSISGDIAIVGGPENDDAGDRSGSAYIFQRDAGGVDNWGEVKKLTASDAATLDFFGQAVSVNGDTAIVGAPLDNQSGSAYVFQRDAGGLGNWGEVRRLDASDGAIGDKFGAAVSISADTAIVGASAESTSGSAYIFQRDDGGVDNWGEIDKLTPSSAAADDLFGATVSISADIAIAGALWDDDAGSQSGSAYVLGDPLIVDAGVDQMIPEGSFTALVGSASGGAQSATLTYLWTQVSGTPASMISGDTTPVLNVQLPPVDDDTPLIFKLEAADGLTVAEDTVEILAIDVDARTADLTVAATPTSIELLGTGSELAFVGQLDWGTSLEDASWSRMRFQVTTQGDVDVLNEISSVTLYIDEKGDGAVDPGDRTIGLVSDPLLGQTSSVEFLFAETLLDASPVQFLLEVERTASSPQRGSFGGWYSLLTLVAIVVLLKRMRRGCNTGAGITDHVVLVCFSLLIVCACSSGGGGGGGGSGSTTVQFSIDDSAAIELRGSTTGVGAGVTGLPGQGPEVTLP